MQKFYRYLIAIAILLPLVALAEPLTNNNADKTAQYLSTIENNPPALQVFLQNMPKGADLHNHLAGAAYAENLLDDAKTDRSCFDLTTLTVNNSPNCRMKVANITAQPDLYDRTINAWSMRDFVPTSTETTESHFFATFLKFFPLLASHNSQVLSEITQRAANEHIDYLELMISSYDLNMPMGPDGDPSTTLGKKIGWSDDFAKLRQAYLANGLTNIVASTRQHIDVMENLSHQQMLCGSTKADPACGVTVRYEYYALRDLPPEEFFAQLVTGFELANNDPRVVAINIVRPEDDYVSAHNYHLEMHMLDYLHRVYPKVHIALHAGELSVHQVPPEELRFHIREAIEVGHAERIGHGTDIAYEDNAAQLLNEMASKPIPVEISLTSNADLLGVYGNQHPLPLYLTYHVPVTLSTDDEGILRSNLTHEYELAVSEYHLNYATLKNIARNGLAYNFMPGASLWQNAASAIPVSVCANEILGNNHPSAACQQFLNNSQKAQLQWKLENEFTVFENRIAQQHAA